MSVLLTVGKMEWDGGTEPYSITDVKLTKFYRTHDEAVKAGLSIRNENPELGYFITKTLDEVDNGRAIKVVWSIYDVWGADMSLSMKEAEDVLKLVDRDYDASRGITWDTIRETIQQVKSKRQSTPVQMLADAVAEYLGDVPPALADSMRRAKELEKKHMCDFAEVFASQYCSPDEFRSAADEEFNKIYKP